MSFYTQVGLRWWNYIDENGDSQWMFEKRNGDSVHLLSATEVLYKFSILIGDNRILSCNDYEIYWYKQIKNTFLGSFLLDNASSCTVPVANSISYGLLQLQISMARSCYYWINSQVKH